MAYLKDIFRFSVLKISAVLEESSKCAILYVKTAGSEASGRWKWSSDDDVTERSSEPRARRRLHMASRRRRWLRDHLHRAGLRFRLHRGDRRVGSGRTA